MSAESDKPPSTLDYAVARVVPPKVGAIAKLGWVAGLATLASMVSCDYGYNSLYGGYPRRLGAYIGLVDWALIVTSLFFMPYWVNASAPELVNLSDDQLPFPKRVRRLFHMLFFVAMGIGVGVVKCPHGCFVTFGAWGIAADGTPCNNDRNPLPLAVFLLRELLG